MAPHGLHFVFLNQLSDRDRAARDGAASREAREIGEVEAGSAELAAERAQHAPAGTRFARQLAAGDGALLAAFEVGQRGIDLGQRADRQDHVGDRARATGRRTG